MFSRFFAFFGVPRRRAPRDGDDRAVGARPVDPDTDETRAWSGPEPDETRLACEAGPEAPTSAERTARERLSWPARDLSRSQLVGRVPAADATLLVDPRAAPGPERPPADATVLVARPGRRRPSGS